MSAEQPAGEGERDPREVPRELKLELPAVHSAARMARRLIRPFARSSGIAGRDLDVLLLVAEELLTNAVDHGGGRAAQDETELSGAVRMSMQLTIDPKQWEARVSDQGGGDPAALEELLRSDEPPNLEDERGRGFFLLNQLVDRLTVRRSEDGRGLQVIAVRFHGERGGHAG